MNNGVYDPAVAAALGLKNGENIYNTDIGNVIKNTATSYNPNATTEQGVANQQQLATYNALNQLAGNTGPGFLNAQNIGGAKGLDTSNLQQNLAGQIATAQGLYNTANTNLGNQLIGNLPNYMNQLAARSEQPDQQSNSNVSNADTALANMLKQSIATSQAAPGATNQQSVLNALAAMQNGTTYSKDLYNGNYNPYGMTGNGASGNNNLLRNHEDILNEIKAAAANYNSYNPNLVVRTPDQANTSTNGDVSSNV